MTPSEKDKVEAVKFYDEAVRLAHQYDFERKNPKKLKEAIKLFQKAIKRYPSMANAYIGIANCQLKLNQAGDLGSAISNLEKALFLEPENSYAHLNLGRCLDIKGDLEGAITEMQIAISSNPLFYTAHFDIGRLYLRKNDYPNAKQHLQLASNSEFTEISSVAKGLLDYINKQLQNEKP